MSKRALRILVITPWVPYPVTGACQQDRFAGLQLMKSLGYDVQVIAKIHSFQDRAQVEAVFRQEKIPLTLTEHSSNPGTLLWQNMISVIKNPVLIDGSALEYADSKYQEIVLQNVKNNQPDVIWLEYTMLWPLLHLLKPMGIPLIMKSSLNEPLNCIDEHGGSILSRLKSIPKFPGEKIAATKSDVILAITPQEQVWYERLGAKHSFTLPLRALSRCLSKKTHANKDVLDVIFLSSNYNMGHNRDALGFLLRDIIPAVRKHSPGAFRFHLTGKKFPHSLRKYLAEDVEETGFVPDIGTYISTMDIALCPWISGHGMQQKVFEPLCRSLPLLTTKTGGYPFEDRKELFLCRHPEEYAENLELLRNTGLRQSISEAAYKKCETLFGEQAIKATMEEAVNTALSLHAHKPLSS